MNDPAHQGCVVPAEVRVADELAIRNVLMRYCRGIDRLDFDVVRSCYWPEAPDERGQFMGTVEGFLEYAEGVLRSMIASTHFMGNVLVEFIGPTRAHVESYCLSLDRFADETGQVHDSFSQLRYLDLMEQREGRWAIAHRRMLVDASSSRPVDPEQASLGLKNLTGSRDRQDPVYTTFADWTS